MNNPLVLLVVKYGIATKSRYYIYNYWFLIVRKVFNRVHGI